MATAFTALGTATWVSWLLDDWDAGISPLVVFDQALQGFVTRPVEDAQLAALNSGALAGGLVRIMGPTLSIAGNFGEPNPLPLTGTITGFRIYDRYEPLLVFDDPNNQILTNSGALWDGQLIADVSGVSIDAATLQAQADPPSSLRDALLALDSELNGTALDDVIEGGPGSDTINGGDGSDFLTPGPGRDTVNGGAGSDMVNYLDLAQGVEVNLEGRFARSNGETDTLNGIENITGTIFADFLRGDDADNRIRGLGDYDWMVGSNGNDFYDGGNGRDMISYVNASSGVEVNLALGRGYAGQAAGDRYVSIERVTGSIYSDLIYGDNGENDFRGLGGYDWFVGSGGGKDRYDGGSGQDTVAYSQSAAGVVASLLLGRGSGGDAARDLYTSIENLTGSSHDDVLTGDNGRNVLRGLYGEDTIFGNGGVDRITGGGSNDYIDGGSGWDYAYFSGNRAEYTITQSGSTTTVARIAAGGDGIDTLVNVEVAVFADGDFLL